MENDLISRSALIEEISKCTIISDDLYGMGIMSGVDAIKKKVENAPAVDAVPVVRCRDCKHYMTINCTCDGCCISDYWFCADGERKVDDGK